MYVYIVTYIRARCLSTKFSTQRFFPFEFLLGETTVFRCHNVLLHNKIGTHKAHIVVCIASRLSSVTSGPGLALVVLQGAPLLLVQFCPNLTLCFSAGLSLFGAAWPKFGKGLLQGTHHLLRAYKRKTKRERERKPNFSE